MALHQTIDLLNVLDDYQSKRQPFSSGKMGGGHPDLDLRILKRGHSVRIIL